ncbi:hypothetical protein PG984_014226 [Apiospora sp. TS-2023a]
MPTIESSSSNASLSPVHPALCSSELDDTAVNAGPQAATAPAEAEAKTAADPVPSPAASTAADTEPEPEPEPAVAGTSSSAYPMASGRTHGRRHKLKARARGLWDRVYRGHPRGRRSGRRTSMIPNFRPSTAF